MSSSPSRSTHAAVLAVLAASALFGTTGTARVLGAPGASGLSVGATRLAAGGCLLVVMAVRERGIRTVWQALTSPAGCWCAAGAVAYNVAFFTAAAHSGVAVATVVTIGVVPLATGALEWSVRGTRPGRAWAGATAMLTAGLLLVLAGAARGRASAAGVGAALVAAVGFATYVVQGRPLAQRWGRDVYVAATFGGAAAVALPVLAVEGVRGGLAWAGTPGGLGAAVWLAVVPTALAYRLFGRGVAVLPGPVVSSLTLAEPAFAAVLGAVVLDEPLGPSAVGGFALVAVGVMALARKCNDNSRPKKWLVSRGAQAGRSRGSTCRDHCGDGARDRAGRPRGGAGAGRGPGRRKHQRPPQLLLRRQA